MKKLLIVATLFLLTACDGENQLTEEKVRVALIKCLDDQLKVKLTRISPIFIQNNEAKSNFIFTILPDNRGREGRARFHKDSEGNWYLTHISTSYSAIDRACKKITPLLAE